MEIIWTCYIHIPVMRIYIIFQALYPFASCEIRDPAEDSSYMTQFSILCRDLLKNEVSMCINYFF